MAFVSLALQDEKKLLFLKLVSTSVDTDVVKTTLRTIIIDNQIDNRMSVSNSRLRAQDSHLPFFDFEDYVDDF